MNDSLKKIPIKTFYTLPFSDLFISFGIFQPNNNIPIFVKQCVIIRSFVCRQFYLIDNAHCVYLMAPNESEFRYFGIIVVLNNQTENVDPANLIYDSCTTYINL